MIVDYQVYVGMGIQRWEWKGWKPWWLQVYMDRVRVITLPPPPSFHPIQMLTLTELIKNIGMVNLQNIIRDHLKLLIIFKMWKPFILGTKV